MYFPSYTLTGRP